MRQVSSLNHSRWECKYDVIFIPKYRKKAIFGQIRRDLGDVLKRLAQQKESRIEEGHLMPDHVLCGAPHNTCNVKFGIMWS